jgi:predicted LPLAT superfamily acyltransferase
LAAASGAPLFQVFVVREKLGKYRFFAFPPWHVGKEMLRKPPAALDPLVQEYAARLASVAQQCPLQWYNIYDYWEPPGEPHESSAEAALAGSEAVKTA